MVGSAPARADTKGFLMSADARAQRTQIRMAMAVAGLMMAHQVAGKASPARDLHISVQLRRPAGDGHRAASHIVASIVGGARGRVRSHRIAPGPSPRQLASAGSGCCSAMSAHGGVHLYVHVVAFGAVLMSGLVPTSPGALPASLAKGFVR